MTNVNKIAAVFLATVFLWAMPCVAQPIITNQYILYKSGATSLPTQATAAWEEPSNAYTAITIPMPFDVWKAKGATLSSATTQIVWKANSLYADTGAGIMLCPSQSHAELGLVGCSLLTYFAANDTQGPASYTPGCVSNPGGPMPCRSNITSALQTAIQNGIPLYLVAVSYGNGTNGPLIYDVEIFIDWNMP